VTRADLAGRVAAVAALADPIRRSLYLYVSAQPAPVSRDQASDALGIARHTAKFHLDKLAEEGLLDISFKRLSERRVLAVLPSCTPDPIDSFRLSCRNADTTSPDNCWPAPSIMRPRTTPHPPTR
jgi:Helix-turn-helix domain